MSSTEQLRNDLQEILVSQVGQQGNRNLFKINIHKSLQGRPVSSTKPIRPAGFHSPHFSPRDYHVVKTSTLQESAPPVQCQNTQSLASARKYDRTRKSTQISKIQMVRDSDSDSDDEEEDNDLQKDESDDVGEDKNKKKIPKSKAMTKLFARSSTQANTIIKFPIDSYSREHIEIKACLLTYMNRINVEELLLLQQQAQKEIDLKRQQKMFYAGCTIDDGSLQQSSLHKTMFLLRHFFEIEQNPTKFSKSHSTDRYFEHSRQFSYLLFAI
jgi:hypothetical protein